MPHIFVIDDEPDIRDLIADILRDEQFQVTSASCGKDALMLLDSCMDNVPDAIILDVWMPDMDGIATLRELRRNGYSGPVLSLSGDQFFLNDQAPAFNGSLTKPMSKYEIVDAVSSHLSNP